VRLTAKSIPQGDLWPLLISCLAIVSVVIIPATGSAAWNEATASPCRSRPEQCAGSNGRSYFIHSDYESAQISPKGGAQAGRHAPIGSARVWAYVPACPNNGPPGTLADALCVDATQSCAIASQVRFREYMAIGNGPWTPTGTVCLGPTDFQRANAPAPPLLVALEVWRRMPVPVPRLTIKPGVAGLANLESYFWVSDPGDLTASAAAGPNTVEVHASAVSYEWRFGDGSPPLVTDAPGRPWPARSEIAHAYRQLGRFPVRVTVRWHGRFQVNGGPAQDVPGPPVVRAATVTYPVREIQTVLVN
jgi:hypothetical protein